MKQLGGVEEVFSSLYVDFDNIYTRLAEMDPELGRAFGTMPQRWTKWLEIHALRILYGEGVRRRILKRICYMNPQCYQEFRPYFIRAAFQVVDCPPLTQQGKTSADIHLVMDCMDDLSHSTRFDEFIILSGDADFTPVLVRLQEHARRTLVLSVGYSSPAYTAAASWRIREDWFIQQALEDPKDEEVGSGRSEHLRPREKYRHAIESIKRILTDAPAAVSFANLQLLLGKNRSLTEELSSESNFISFLEMLDLGSLEISYLGEGHVYDPERHELPAVAAEREEFRIAHPDLFKLAITLHRFTDLPLLKPERWPVLLGEIVEEVNLNGFSLRTTIPNVRTRCFAKGIPISGNNIERLFRTISHGGCRLIDRKHATLQEIGKALLLGTHALCKSAQLQLNEEERRMLMAWLMPKSLLDSADLLQ